MGKVYLYFTLFLLSCAHFVCAASTQNISPHNEFTSGTPIPDFKAMSPSPRLFMKADDVAKIKVQLSGSPEMAALHESALEFAKKLKERPLLKRNQVGFRILHTSKEAGLRIMYWGYAYRMTGDKSFADRAAKEIQNIANFSDWNPQHYLDVSEMALAFAVAYDWFFDAFDDATKKLIVEQIDKKAFDTFLEKKHGWFDAEKVNNWNQICNMGLLCAAISIHDALPEKSEKVIKKNLKNIEKGLSQCYSQEGMYIEGYGYWSGSTMFQTFFICALESAFGTDFGLTKKYGGYLKSGEFACNMVGTSGYVYNFFDSSKSNPNHPQPLLIWFAKRTNKPELLYTEKEFYTLGSKKRVGANSMSFILALIYAADTNFEKIQQSKQKTWQALSSENQLFLARTSWDKDGLFLGIKGGRANLSHGHMDGGSFVFDALATRWAHDLGSQDYNSLEKLGMNIWSFSKRSDRWKVFRYSNFSHNMLTVNGSLIDPAGKAKFLETSSDKNKLSAKIDTTALYAPALKKVIRDAEIIDEKFLRITDSIENGKDKSKIRWNLCTFKSAKIMGKNSVEITAPNGKKLLLKLVSPSTFKPVILDTAPRNTWDCDNKDTTLVGFEGEIESNKNCQIIVEFIPIKK